MSADSERLHDGSDRSTAETVAGYLSAIAIFIAVIGLVWHPIRLILPAGVVALVAAGMAGPGRRLQFTAVIFCAVCFFLGMTIAVATSRPLW